MENARCAYPYKKIDPIGCNLFSTSTNNFYHIPWELLLDEQDPIPCAKYHILFSLEKKKARNPDVLSSEVLVY